MKNMKMKRIVVLSFVLLLTGSLAACTGHVNLAKTPAEGLKTGYNDPELVALSQKYNGSLKEIYARYTSKGMGVAKEGLGFTSLSDKSGRRVYYLFVETHHEECNFDKNTTTGQQRLQVVLQRYFEPELRVLTKKDIASDDISGLAFGVAWAVRDFYQCDKYGGFVEYVIAYISKSDFYAIVDGTKTVNSVLANSEVITSLDLQPATSIKLKYQQ
jgi:hypothetical protein